MADESNSLGIGEVLRRSKGIDILFSLLDKPMGINEIQLTVGGSATTIQDRVNELIKDGFISESEAGKFPFKRVITLTQKGEMAAKALQGMKNDALKGKLPNERVRWLLSILYMLIEIKGITRLEKLLFILKQDLRLEDGAFYRFIPEQFGPYSREILDDIYELKNLDLINVSGDAFESKSGDFIIRWNFMLTDFGKKIAKTIFSNIDTATRKKITNLESYNLMKLTDLLEHVHSEYPEFLKRK